MRSGFKSMPCSTPTQYSSASAGSVSGSEAARQRRRLCRWRHRCMDVGLRPALPWSDSEIPSGANRSSCADGLKGEGSAQSWVVNWMASRMSVEDIRGLSSEWKMRGRA